MATGFDNVEKDFYNAFFIPDPVKRRAAINDWVETVTPIIKPLSGRTEVYLEV